MSSSETKNGTHPAWSIWVEGWRSSDGEAPARLVAVMAGPSFQEACDAFAEADGDWKRYYDRDRLTYWGCRLFDNEADARKAFG